MLCIVGVLLGQQAAAGESFRDFAAAYRCDVARRLELIYATGDPAKSLNRYLAISEPAKEYVQCIFYDMNRHVHCEASTGFWKTKRGSARTASQTPRTIAALVKLGFDTDDSAGNLRAEAAGGLRTCFLIIAQRKGPATAGPF